MSPRASASASAAALWTFVAPALLLLRRSSLFSASTWLCSGAVHSESAGTAVRASAAVVRQATAQQPLAASARGFATASDAHAAVCVSESLSRC